MKTDSRRSGQTMVEYIIIVVVIAIAALAVFGILGDTVTEKGSGVVNSLTTTDNADKAQAEAKGNAIDKLKGLEADGSVDGSSSN